MSIQTDHLQAFLLVHETGSFTEASQRLGLTQSALSQKIRRLEDGLETVLFVRHPQALELTSAGERLLGYARQQHAFEKEFLQNFEQGQHELAGVLRVAGFSSVMRSVIMPSLAAFLRKHTRVQVSFSHHEMNELPQILKSNAADLVLLDYVPAIAGVESLVIGKENYVVIESARHDSPADIYLDHGPDDNATDSYFRAQGGKQLAFRRGFMGDVYGILDGVAMGLGRAVMSEHLVLDDKRLKKVNGFKTYSRPLSLAWAQQSWYPKLHTQVRDVLRQEVKNWL